MHLHQLGQVEPRALHHLHLPNEHVMQRIDTLARLHDVTGDRVWDELVNTALQVLTVHLLDHDVTHLLTNVPHLDEIS